MVHDDKPSKWDIFVSHASEDKAGFVAPLARALSEFDIKVWYDEFTLQVGDSLSRSIDKGLAKSDYGLVVLSPAFLAKKWPEYELRGLIAKELVGKKVILPLWHGVSYADVLAFSPSLADKKAIKNEKTSISSIAIEIIEAIRPDVFTKILRRMAFIRSMEQAKPEKIPFDKLKLGPIRHPTLPDEFIGRVRLLRAAFFEVDPHSMEHWLDGFRRDSHPTRELAFWERLGAAYLESVTLLKAKGRVKREQIFYFLEMIALGSADAIRFEHIDKLSQTDRETIVSIYASAYPISDLDEGPDDAGPESMSEKELQRWERGDKESFPDVPEHLVREAIRRERQDG